jgi:hypothetical protein
VANWPIKDPNEVLDYEVDWSLRLETGETITSSDFTVVDGSVTLGAKSIDGESTITWLSGGTAGELCVILNRIVTSIGRTYDQSVKLRVRSR